MEDVQGIAEVNGTRLYYRIQGSGHPLVLIHGMSLDTRMWEPQVEPFYRLFKVIRYDVRGYGKSDVPGPEGYYHSDDLKALLDHLRIDRAHVLGLSLGGAIALEFALAHPHMATSLVLVDSAVWGHEWTEEGSRLMEAIGEAGKRGGVEAAREVWLAHPMFKAVLQNPVASARCREIIADFSGWHWTHPDPGLLPDPVAAERLEEVAAPTLVIVGERDTPDIQAMADTLQARVPHAQKVVIPDVGHMANMEDPTTFNRIVLDFLGRMGPAQ